METPLFSRCARVLPCAFALLAWSAGCGTTPREATRSSGEAIVGGQVDDSDGSAVWIVGKLGTRTGYCSGVVVSPHVVLAAAHCTLPGATFKIFLGADYDDSAAQNDPANYVAVAASHPHPQWDPKLNINDIAVFITTDPIPRTPTPVNRIPLTADDVGKPVRIVGFGQTDGGTNLTYGRRHQGMTTIAKYDRETLAIEGVPNTCLDDSGGPTYMQRGGSEVVVGIHFIIEAASCDARSWDTRVDWQLDFIDPYVTAAEKVPDAGVPEGDVADTDAATPSPAAAPTTTTTSGGCAVAGGREGPSWPVLFASVALVPVVLRRRRGVSRAPKGPRMK